MPADHVLSARPALRLEELLCHDMIFPRPGSAIDALLSRATAGTGVTPRIRVAGTEAVCSMAAARLGIGLVPARQAERYRGVLAIAARPLLDAPWAMRHLKLCTLPAERLAPATQQLLQHLRGASPAAN
jgi:DNA-binding transcriptional LysR family regulator